MCQWNRVSHNLTRLDWTKSFWSIFPHLAVSKCNFLNVFHEVSTSQGVEYAIHPRWWSRMSHTLLIIRRGVNFLKLNYDLDNPGITSTWNTLDLADSIILQSIWQNNSPSRCTTGPLLKFYYVSALIWKFIYTLA